jgi:hypothetical protein
MMRKLLIISVVWTSLFLCACGSDPAPAGAGLSPEDAKARCEQDEALVMDARRFTPDVALACVVCYEECGDQCAASLSSGTIAYTCPVPPDNYAGGGDSGGGDSSGGDSGG